VGSVPVPKLTGMTENWYPEADPNRDRSMPLWPKLPTVAAEATAGFSGPAGPRAMNRPWARRLATVAAAVALSLGGGTVIGAAGVRLETDTVAVAGLAPGGVSGSAWSGAAAVAGLVARSGESDVAGGSGAAVGSGVAGAASITVVRLRTE
jgi:hypothetical protein